VEKEQRKPSCRTYQSNNRKWTGKERLEGGQRNARKERFGAINADVFDRGHKEKVAVRVESPLGGKGERQREQRQSGKGGIEEGKAPSISDRRKRKTTDSPIFAHRRKSKINKVDLECGGAPYVG